MATLRNIKNQDIRNILSRLRKIINGIKNGKTVYNPKTIISLRDRLINSFINFINNEKFDIPKKFLIDDKDFENSFETEKKKIIEIFKSNVMLAFEKAIASIENAIDFPPKLIRNLGLRSLFFFFTGNSTKKPKKGEVQKVTGFSKRTVTGRNFNITLIPYLINLVDMAQEELKRSSQKTLSIVTGVDLARVSPESSWLGPQADEVCNRWRDRILTIKGKVSGFPTLDDATKREKPPLFHPNCRHKLILLTQEESAIAIKNNALTFTELKKFL